MFLEILKAILMGIVEGITEWLPISSTGHMILVEQVVKFNASEEFMSMFRVVIQLEMCIRDRHICGGSARHPDPQCAERCARPDFWR